MLAAKVTAVEGGVSPSRLASLVAKSFGLNGVKSEKAALLQAIPKKQTNPRDKEGFLFAGDGELERPTGWYKQATGEGRDLDDISLTEIIWAMRDLCLRVHGMSETELFKQTSLAFGRLRLGANASQRLAKALELGVKSGSLKLEDDLVLGVA